MNPKAPELKLTPEELQKVARAKRLREGTKVDENWLFISEFGYYYGWGGVKAILDNEITLEQANTLLAGAKKVWSGVLYDHANAVLIGVASANNKKPTATFKKATSHLLKSMKPDEE